MELRDVQAIWDGVLETLKPYFTGGEYKPKKGKDGFDEWPEFWPGYRRACQERDGLLPHIEHGYYAERLFSLRAPNQTEQEAKYIRDNYRQVTLPVYADYENTILRATNESNYQIDYDTTAEGTEGQDQFKEYITTEVPEYGSLFNFWRYVLPKIKTADAMGVVATLPGELPTVDGEDGPVIDPNGEIKPMPIYFPVQSVWGYDRDRWYLLLTTEKSWITLPSGKEAKEGMVLLLIDDEFIWRIEQVGEKIKRKFEIIKWWAHGCKELPAHQMMGTPKICDGNMVWQSHFMPAAPWCDKVLLDESYLGLCKANGVFPYLVMIGDDCDFVAADKVTRCTNGKLLYYGEDMRIERILNCPSCGGSGQKSRLSPLGRLLINPSETSGEGKGLSVKDSMEWVSPEVTTLEFLQLQIDRSLEMARSLMHVATTTEVAMKGGEQPTATKSGIDLRDKYAFIKPISDQFFDLLEFMMNTTGWMRYGSAFKPIEISRPTTFDIRTEEDWLQELSVAYQNDLPLPAIQHALWGYLRARYGAAGASMRAFETIAKADKLFGVPFLQAQYQLSQGLIEKWQMVLHFESIGLYDDLFDQNKIGKDMNANVEAMIQAAKDATPKEEISPLSIVRDAIGARPKLPAVA